MDADDSNHKNLQAGLGASSSASSSSARAATNATLSSEERDKILAMLDDEPEVNV